MPLFSDYFNLGKTLFTTLPSGARAQSVALIDPSTESAISLGANQEVQLPSDEIFVGSISAGGVALKQDVSRFDSFIFEYGATSVASGNHSLLVEGNSTGVDTDQWFAISGFPVDQASTGAVAARTITSTGIYAYRYQRNFPWIRVRVSTYGNAGQINVRITGSMSTANSNTYTTTPATSANNNNAAQTSPYFGLVGGVTRTSNTIGSDLSSEISVVQTFAKSGQALVLPYSVPEATINYAAPASGISNSNADVIAVAANSTLRHYVTSVQISHGTLSAATEFAITDGTNTFFRCILQTTAESLNITFPVPLRLTSTNTSLRFKTLTAVTGNVYVNLQGYTGA